MMRPYDLPGGEERIGPPNICTFSRVWEMNENSENTGSKTARGEA